jgi:hypothetical protein
MIAVGILLKNIFILTYLGIAQALFLSAIVNGIDMKFVVKDADMRMKNLIDQNSADEGARQWLDRSSRTKSTIFNLWLCKSIWYGAVVLVAAYITRS